MSKPTYAELQKQVALLEKQAAHNGNNHQHDIEFKVGEKGGVSVYGLGRFPVTLYYEQWMRLLDAKVVKSLLAFLESENKAGNLKRKE